VNPLPYAPQCHISSSVEGVNTTCACNLCGVVSTGTLVLAIRANYDFNFEIVDEKDTQVKISTALPFWTFFAGWILVVFGVLLNESCCYHVYIDDDDDEGSGDKGEVEPKPTTTELAGGTLLRNILHNGTDTKDRHSFVGDTAALRASIFLRNSLRRQPAKLNKSRNGAQLMSAYVKSLFVGGLSSGSERSRLVHALLKFHLFFNTFTGENAWIRIVNAYELLSLVSMTLLVTSFVLDLDFRQDPKSCFDMIVESKCVEEKSIFDIRKSRCQWDIDTNICYYVEPVATW
jgi:hypothetical protein